MENYIKRGSLNIHNFLDRFLSDEVLSGLDITSDEFWKKFEGLLEEFHQRNKDLLARRSLLQDQISSWHKSNDFNLQELDAMYLPGTQRFLGYNYWGVATT